MRLLVFFGGRVISPTPRWMAAIRTLHNEYREFGFDIVGIASHSSTPEMTRRDVKELGLKLKTDGDLKLMRGAGCDRCRQTGYLGRMAAIEVMPLTETVRQMIMSGEEAKSITKQARKEGMTTLRENALKMMVKGATTYQEVLRVTVEE